MYGPGLSAPEPALTGEPDQAMLDEIHNHLVYVLTEKLGWTDARDPEMSAGGGHVVIRFERAGHRYVFRVAKHGFPQHKRTMLAYRLVGPLGLMPEKIYHDGVSVVERHVEGGALGARVSWVALERLGQGLARLHALPAQGFGPLDFDNQGAFPDATAYFSEQPEVGLDWAESDVSDVQARVLEDGVEQANRLPPSVQAAPVRLGHGDLWRDNVIVSSESFKIIDWDRIGAYPVERDLAFLLETGLSAG
jgi:aminoglycoside phosphotransferase (APT) family kinase protein